MNSHVRKAIAPTKKLKYTVLEKMIKDSRKSIAKMNSSWHLPQEERTPASSASAKECSAGGVTGQDRNQYLTPLGGMQHKSRQVTRTLASL